MLTIKMRKPKTDLEQGWDRIVVLTLPNDEFEIGRIKKGTRTSIGTRTEMTSWTLYGSVRKDGDGNTVANRLTTTDTLWEMESRMALDLMDYLGLGTGRKPTVFSSDKPVRRIR